MKEILEKVMNFINENTMLLIFICIFLIIILIIYLIDNTIKTRKLEKEESMKKTEEPVILNNEIPERKDDIPEVAETPVNVEEPSLEESKIEEIPEEPEIPEVEPEIAVEEPKVEVIQEPEVPVVPVIDSNIDELLNKDYSMNNEIVNNISTGPVEVPSAPVSEKPKSKYNNDKKLSDIFGKKEVPVSKKIETTQDFSDELDRILQKLNSEESKIDEETNDYTNMF